MEPILRNQYEGMPRTDYPRPMWMRNEWYSLNGEWEFEFDFGVSAFLSPCGVKSARAFSKRAGVLMV